MLKRLAILTEVKRLFAAEPRVEREN